MSNITIGGLALDETYAPLVNLSFEYFKTKGGEIIGGLQKFTITGVVTVSDSLGLETGRTVMSKLKGIRSMGMKPKCYLVNIPGFYSGQAKVTNVTIDQGSDPTWVNQGAFSMEISAPLSSIPTNSLGITATDSVTEISKSETVEIGEDAHGYVLVDDNTLSKTYIKFTNKINLTCKPLCSSSTANPIAILKKLVSIGPTHDSLRTKYKSWRLFLQSRSLEISTEGSVSFISDIILLPPSSTGKAFVDIGFEHKRTYETEQTTKTISGTVTGLSEVVWSGLIDISDTSSSSKFSNAESVFQTLKDKYVDISSWAGLIIELTKVPGCPKKTSTSIGRCGDDDDDVGGGNIIPTSSTISKDRTEGVISFTFEWSSDSDQECSESNGKKTEVTVEIVEPQATIIENIIPGVGTLIQNLNCKSAETLTFTSTTTDPKEGGCSNNSKCSTEEAINKEIRKYIPGGSGGKWLIIENTRTTSTNSFSVTIKYIKQCT